MEVKKIVTRQRSGKARTKVREGKVTKVREGTEKGQARQGVKGEGQDGEW